jgi:hypothetical protein
VVIKKGAKFSRPVFIAAALALTGKLLYESYARR